MTGKALFEKSAVKTLTAEVLPANFVSLSLLLDLLQITVNSSDGNIKRYVKSSVFDIIW
uniref:Bm14210 n=1 Tax=Brugia malayi TaxID=6279 RepID=A0A1I9FZZ6_BRUMA|nr:Bm14210 [Brugia malayi]